MVDTAASPVPTAPAVPPAPAVPSAPSSVALRLVEDVVQAWEYLTNTVLLGSPLLPRIVRRFLLNVAGSHAESSPGHGFALTGDARLLTIGRGVFFNRGVSVESIAPVSIGANTAIGMQVLIVTSHHAIDAAGRWSEAATGRPVVIGERVWIGARATVLPGAHIEHDVVVAAGAVVTGHLAAHGVYGGVPAKRLRDLTPSEPVPVPVPDPERAA